MSLPGYNARTSRSAADISIMRATDELAEKHGRIQTQRKHVVERERDIMRRGAGRVVVVIHLHVYLSALTVAQASSIRQADSSDTSSTPRRTLLPSFNAFSHSHCVYDIAH